MRYMILPAEENSNQETKQIKKTQIKVGQKKNQSQKMHPLPPCAHIIFFSENTNRVSQKCPTRFQKKHTPTRSHIAHTHPLVEIHHKKKKVPRALDFSSYHACAP